MKKKYFLNVPIMLVAVVALMFSSCKKETKNNGSTGANDALVVASAVDATSQDADAVMGNALTYVSNYNPANNAGLAGSGDSSLAPLGFFRVDLCGSVYTDTSTATDHLRTITYDGYTHCQGIIRSGEVTIEHSNSIPWDQAGGQLTVTYINLKVTDVKTKDWYILNGTHLITNETGGLAWKIIAQIVPSGTTVTHRHTSSNMTVTRSNGSTAAWSVDRTRSWNLTGQVISISVYGEARNSITETGTDGNGNAFTDQISQVIKASNVCEWNPTQGNLIHAVAGGSTSNVLYGTTSTGSPSTGACGQGYYITTTTTSPSGTSSEFVGY